MNLFLQREPSDEHATHGDLYIQNIWACFTVELVVREKKIKGETAIPSGTYRLTMEDSPTFGADTITINDVPGFPAIAFSARPAAHPHGCILVGQGITQNSVSKSEEALAELKQQIKAALAYHGEAWLTIEDA